jgi:hypothetical protein
MQLFVKVTMMGIIYEHDHDLMNRVSRSRRWPLLFRRSPLAARRSPLEMAI